MRLEGISVVLMIWGIISDNGDWLGVGFSGTIFVVKLPQSAKYIVDMTATFSKEELVAALRNTFIGDSESLKQTTAYFGEVSKKTGTPRTS